jgi:type II secretory pathway pseudopilin PulG
MSIFDTLNQIGGAVGTVGSAIAAYIASKLREARDQAGRARKERERAEDARRAIEGVLDQVRALAESTKRGVRLELEDRLAQAAPMAQAQVEIRLAEIHRRIDELKSEVLYERSARKKLQEELSQESREEERQWKDLQHTLAQIQTEVAVIKVIQMRK